ncbi:AraC-like DNA-binding protein [Evansella vedderi]|uniref:AraC-like DNA-binding protein n=2 Tax=Evansella vedderi TaxID=38282 RepID=A0ABT9ZT14_9BACI|nr:AraC-like DNA-binding protein [Evansella vedderi]
MADWLKGVFKTFNFITGNQRKYFHRLIWLGCISACIPVLLIGGLYYYWLINSLTQQIESETQSALGLFKERSESILQTIEMESNKIGTSSLITESFTSPDFANDLFYHLEILDTLKVATLENRFVAEVYYFNNRNNIILSNEYGYIPYQSFKYQKDIDEILKTNQNVAWLNLPESSKDGYISFIRKLPNLNAGTPLGILVFQVKKDLLLEYFPTERYQFSFIIDPQERLILQDIDYTKDLYTYNDNALNLVFNSNASSGMFYEKNVDGTNTLYAYNQSASFGRIYLSIVPNDVITDQLSWFRSMIFYSVLGFLCIGILLTIYNMRRAYNPIKEIMDYTMSISKNKNKKSDSIIDINMIIDNLKNLNQEKEMLGKYIKKMNLSLRELFFQQLIEGDHILNNNFYSQCKEYNIPLESNYVAMVINMTNYNDINSFEDKDKPIIFFSVKNIILEIIANNKYIEGVEIVSIKNNLVTVFSFPSERNSDDIIKNLKKLSLNISESVEKYLSLNISIGIGNVYSNVIDVTTSYNQALTANKYRIYQEKDTSIILYIDDVEQSKKSGMFFYPRELEKKLLESLKVGDIKQAERNLFEFSKATSLYKSYNQIYQCFHLLLSSIIMTLEKQGNCINDIFELDLFGQLKEIHTIDEINEWFINNLFPLYKTLTEEKEKLPGKNAVKQVCHFINDNIAQDITLTQCAELVNLTPSYLSRLFKKEVGVNFREYVLIRKVEEAKNLCIETDARISEIAKAVGYSERNLTRLFHKYADMTLSQYRNMHR